MRRITLKTGQAFSARRSSAGFTLLEVIVALIVITAMLGAAAVWLGRYNDRVANELVAGQMRRLGDAVKQYVDDNAAELSKGSSPVKVPWDKVKPYLPAGLDQNTVNPFGQTYDGRLRVVTLPKGGKRVDMLIYTGTPNADVATHSRKVARLLGAGGLYYDFTRVNGVTGSKLTYWNATGQVSDPASVDGFWIGGSLKSSDIGLIMYVPSLGDEASDAPDLNGLLHRKAVANHPEWNRMETDIDMNSSGLNNVDAVNMTGNRELNGVNRIQFVRQGDDKASPISVAVSSGGWFTIGSPTGNRTDLWANKITADGDLQVNSNSLVKGNSTVNGELAVKGSSSITGNESVGETMSAKRVETTGAVVAGRDLALKNGDLIFQGEGVAENTGCAGAGHFNRNSAGDLMACKGSKWTAVGGAFTHGNSGYHYYDFNYNQKRDSSVYADALNWNFGRSKFVNKLNVPVLVTATTLGDYNSEKSRCFIGVYPANSSGVTSGNTYPIAFVVRPQHPKSGDNKDAIYLAYEICSATFIAPPGARYNVVTSYGGIDAQFSYTY